MKPDRTYPWSGLKKPGDFFLIPGRIDHWRKEGLYAVPRRRGWRVRVRSFSHSVKVQRIT